MVNPLLLNQDARLKDYKKFIASKIRKLLAEAVTEPRRAQIFAVKGKHHKSRNYYRLFSNNKQVYNSFLDA